MWKSVDDDGAVLEFYCMFTLLPVSSSTVVTDETTKCRHGNRIQKSDVVMDKLEIKSTNKVLCKTAFQLKQIQFMSGEQIAGATAVSTTLTITFVVVAIPLCWFIDQIRL